MEKSCAEQLLHYPGHLWHQDPVSIWHSPYSRQATNLHKHATGICCYACLCMTSLMFFQAGHVDRTGHTSKTSSFNDRRESQDQPEAFQRIDSQSTNFEAVYNDGLILQEKASQAGGSAQEQLDLLKQVGKPLNHQSVQALPKCRLAEQRRNCQVPVTGMWPLFVFRHVTNTMRLGSFRQTLTLHCTTGEWPSAIWLTWRRRQNMMRPITACWQLLRSMPCPSSTAQTTHRSALPPSGSINLFGHAACHHSCSDGVDLGAMSPGTTQYLHVEHPSTLHFMFCSIRSACQSIHTAVCTSVDALSARDRKGKQEGMLLG